MKLEIKRRKSKIREKIAICLRMLENCSTFAPESCEIRERGSAPR